ncbi:MAG: sel1 repeat family protein [Methylococcales bacterium]|nr:sel1 repeat family protein [Methylococcales bacterium]
MHIKVLAANRLIIISLLLCITACAHKEPPKETIRICDPDGCSDRPKGYSSFDPAKDTPEEDPGGKIAALEELAARDPRAAYDLALRFFRGDGIRQDSYRSIKWMRDAAERGDFDAQKALGRLYLTGLGEMGSDPGEAEKWLSITASRGDKEASTLLSEATAARQSVQAEYRWYNRWRPVFYNYWYSGYRYRWYWRTGRWYSYY